MSRLGFYTLMVTIVICEYDDVVERSGFDDSRNQ